MMLFKTIIYLMLFAFIYNVALGRISVKFEDKVILSKLLIKTRLIN
jgi:hypothetical protein